MKSRTSKFGLWEHAFLPSFRWTALEMMRKTRQLRTSSFSLGNTCNILTGGDFVQGFVGFRGPGISANPYGNCRISRSESHWHIIEMSSRCRRDVVAISSTALSKLSSNCRQRVRKVSSTCRRNVIEMSSTCRRDVVETTEKQILKHP